MKVYVVREDDGYGGGARVLGVRLSAEDGKALAQEDAGHSLVWRDRAEADKHGDLAEGRVGGFGLEHATGLAYVISEHEVPAPAARGDFVATGFVVGARHEIPLAGEPRGSCQVTGVGQAEVVVGEPPAT